MKPLEWIATIGMLLAAGAMVVFVALIAAIPYIAFGAIVLVCARYLGWF